jgi:hypothetical protein
LVVLRVVVVEPEKIEVPIGLAHLAMVRNGAIYVAGETSKVVDEFKPNNEMIGTSLSVLYQAATCHRKCHGGAHVLEGLCGRAYNLGCAAYNLTYFGFYDEALNLTRGIGELTNFIMLGAADGTVIQKWLKADHKTRIREFGPAAVRKMLEAKNIRPCATKDWYGELSESYTHITPHTQPNFLSSEARSRKRGFQDASEIYFTFLSCSRCSHAGISSLMTCSMR